LGVVLSSELCYIFCEVVVEVVNYFKGSLKK